MLSVLLVVLSLLVLLQFIALYLILRARQYKPNEEQRLLRETKSASQSIIHRAMRQANRMVVAAELKGIELLARFKLLEKARAEEFARRLETIENTLETQLTRETSIAEQSYQEFLKSLERDIAKHSQDNEQVLNKKSDTMIGDTRKLMEGFIASINEKMQKQLDEEFAQAKEEIGVYKQHRMKAIDDRVIDILEDISRIVFLKKLTVADHSDLIYRALETAKQENALPKIPQR